MRESVVWVTPKIKRNRAAAVAIKAGTVPATTPAPGTIGMIGRNVPVKEPAYRIQNKTRRAETVVHRPASVPPNAVGANGANVAGKESACRKPLR